MLLVNRLEVSDIRCHFMTRVMGSHFFTPDSRRSAASQPRISQGLRVEFDRPCWPSSCNSNVREREGAELIFGTRDQPRTPGSASTIIDGQRCERDAVVVEFPGGYIAEIHSITKK